jgi:hypothetical protein
VDYKSAEWGKQKIDPTKENFGLANRNINQPIPRGPLHEGSRFSKFMNKMFYGNAGSTFHDTLGQKYFYFSEAAWDWFGSPATILPAAAITYGAAAAQYPWIIWSVRDNKK